MIIRGCFHVKLTIWLRRLAKSKVKQCVTAVEYIQLIHLYYHASRYRLIVNFYINNAHIEL